MLGVGGAAPPLTPPPVALNQPSSTGKPSFFFLQSQFQTHKPNLPNYTQLLAKRSGFRLFAQKKGSGLSTGSIELDFEDDVDEHFDDVAIPFEKMEGWLENKPMGFGVEKVYDTSVEDKLIEEIEQSRKSQLQNIVRLKNDKSKIELNKDLKASEVISSEIRVRINYLPKKKNVHKDLKSAFEGVQGIFNISPVVYGNKKTRDPVCKGFGFVDFKSWQDANRFIQMFSGQSVAFGKIQKEIKCEIWKADDDAYKGLAQHVPSSEPKLAPLGDELDQNLNIEENDPSLLLLEENEFDDEDVIDDIKLLKISEAENDDIARKGKVSQLSISVPAGPAVRLKVREYAELSDVFSRSGAKEALNSKEIFMASEDNEDQDYSLQFRENGNFDEDDVQNIDLVRASNQEDNNDTELNVKPSPSALSIHNEKQTLKEDPKITEVTENPKTTPIINIQALAKMLKIRDTAKLVEFISRSRESKDRQYNINNIEEDLLQFIGEEGFHDIDDDEEEIKFLSKLKQGENYDTKPETKAELDLPSSPKIIEKSKVAKPKPVVKGKANKTPKLSS